jgi:hypothetical protein
MDKGVVRILELVVPAMILLGLVSLFRSLTVVGLSRESALATASLIAVVFAIAICFIIGGLPRKIADDLGEAGVASAGTAIYMCAVLAVHAVDPMPFVVLAAVAVIAAAAVFAAGVLITLGFDPNEPWVLRTSVMPAAAFAALAIEPFVGQDIAVQITIAGVGVYAVVTMVGWLRLGRTAHA